MEDSVSPDCCAQPGATGAGVWICTGKRVSAGSFDGDNALRESDA